MRILVSGLNGFMGHEVANLALAGYRGAELVSGVDVKQVDNPPVPCAPSFDEADANADCIIDFSHHEGTKALLDFAVKNNLPLVLATTGQTEEEKAAIQAALYPDLEYIKEGYMYYCSAEAGSGKLVYAKTRAEHNANVAKYYDSWVAFGR